MECFFFFVFFCFFHTTGRICFSDSRIKSHPQRTTFINGNFDTSQDLFVDSDPEHHLSPVKQNKPRRSVLYRKKIQDQINHFCENKKDFHLDVTSPNHPSVNETPKMKYLSSPKHIRAYTEPMTESTSTPKGPRCSMYTAKVQQKIDKYFGSRENVGLDVTSPDHPDLFFTPTAKTPIDYHQKIQCETPLKPLPTMMPFKSEDSSDIGSNSSESDLYITVNEASDYISKSPKNILDLDKLKHSMTHKIVQLQHCLNKLDTENFMTTQPLVSKRFNEVQDIYSRNKDPYLKDLPSEKKLNSKQIQKKVCGPNHDVDVRFKMKLSPKMVWDDGKSSRKLKHSQHQTSEMNVGQGYENRKSKREPVIDIEIQPECESPNIRYKIRNKKEPDPQVHQKSKLQHRSKESRKQKVVMKSSEIQPRHSSRVRSKSAHENTCFQPQQEKQECYSLAGKNIKERCQQDTDLYPGERISQDQLVYDNQRENERQDHKESIYSSMLTYGGLRNQTEIANEHPKNAYITKTTRDILSSSPHITSKNCRSKLSTQNHSSMTSEKVTTAQSHIQLNERPSNFLEREIIPEKSSLINRKVKIVPQLKSHDQQTSQFKKLKDLSKPQQKTVFMKERSECKYLDSDLICENQIFHKQGCMVMSKEQKKDANQKALFQKVAHAPHYEKATKVPVSMKKDSALDSQLLLSNIDSCTKHVSNINRSSISSTDTYYTCQSEMDTEDFYSCENGFETCKNPGNPYFVTLMDTRKMPLHSSSLEEVTELLSSKESSYLKEFEFNQDELVQALSEFDLTDPNTSTSKDTYFNALSNLEDHVKDTEKLNDFTHVEASCDEFFVAADQLKYSQFGKKKQTVEETLCRTKSLLHYIPAQRNNSHYVTTLADTEVRPKSPCAHGTFHSADGQCEEFETAIEQDLFSRTPSKCKSLVSNQIPSKSNSFPPDSSEECSDSDTFFLVCVPSADNEFVSTASQQSNISTSILYDEVDYQNDEISHPKRDESSSLKPVEPDLFHSCVNENMSGKILSDIKDTKNPYSIHFSQVLSELKQKTELKAIQSQKKTCYRWQPPENVMSSSQTSDERFLNGKGKDTMLKVLKKKVGLELKDHPLVKSQKYAIEKFSSSYDVSAQDSLDTSKVLLDKNEQKTAQPYYNSANYEFNEPQLRNLITRKYMDSTKQPQSKKTGILRQNAILVSDQLSKKFSKCDQNKTNYISIQNMSQTSKEPGQRKISEKNQSFPRIIINDNHDFDQSYYHSPCRDESTDHSQYISLKKDSKDCWQSINSDGSLELEQSHYVSVCREGSPKVEQSRYVSICREESSENEQSPETEQSQYASIYREGSPEKSCYASICTEASPEVVHSCYESPDPEHSHYVSVHREGTPDAEHSHYVSVYREGSPDAEHSHYTSICREGAPDAEHLHYVTVHQEGSPNAEHTNYTSIHREGSPDAEHSHYASICREESPDAEHSHYISAHKEFPETKHSGYTSVKELYSKCSRIPTLKDGKLLKQQKVNHSHSLNEPVTLQKRYVSPQNNHSLYLSAQDMTSGQSIYNSSFTENKQSKTNFESVTDNITSSSHWQYVSTKSSAHNRSVTWQNPISTFDEIDAALVDSTDESISLSPRKEGHSPQAIPLTSTSASDEITSESISSDEFKRCLESKKLLSPEKRTSMWVNGIYKSNMQEYFDADMSSILPVFNSHSSSSDTGKDLKCGATAANMKSHHIEPSAPPQSEIASDGSYFDSFKCIPTAPPDISNIAVVGISGDKGNEQSNSDYISLHPSLYPSLVEPCQNSVSKKLSEPQLKDNNDNNLNAHARNASSAAYVSFGSEPEPPLASVHCSPENIHPLVQNKFGLTQKTNMCSIIPPVSSQEVHANIMQLPCDSNLPFLMRSNTVNRLHHITKSISTQTPVLRIPPDPPNKFAPPLRKCTHSKEPNKGKRTPKRWAKLKRFFTGKRIEGKIGDKAFISVDSNQSFLQSCHLSRLEEMSSPLTDTSGTQTDPDIFYEPTFKHLEIVKSDEVSLSVNLSEQLTDYSEKYPLSILDLSEDVEQVTHSNFLETCSSSGATSGSMERLLSPYQEDSNEDDFDEVDCVQVDMHPIKEVGKDKDHQISTETKICGEIYKTKLFKTDRRESNDVEFLHIDPEMQIQFIERQISTESNCGEQLDDSDSTEIYDWKSFSKSEDDLDAVVSAETKSFYWRTCGEKPDDSRPNLKKLKKPLTSLGSLSDAELRQTLIDHGLPNPGPITQNTRQMYLKRLKTVSSSHSLGCSLTSPGNFISFHYFFSIYLCQVLNNALVSEDNKISLL